MAPLKERKPVMNNKKLPVLVSFQEKNYPKNNDPAERNFSFILIQAVQKNIPLPLAVRCCCLFGPTL